jgi:hypothetical protein
MAWGISLKFGIGDFHVILWSNCEIRNKLRCDFDTLHVGANEFLLYFLYFSFYLDKTPHLRFPQKFDRQVYGCPYNEHSDSYILLKDINSFPLFPYLLPDLCGI